VISDILLEKSLGKLDKSKNIKKILYGEESSSLECEKLSWEFLKGVVKYETCFHFACIFFLLN